MTIQELKQQIELKQITDNLIILKDTDGFISNQYIRAISQIRGLQINYLDSPMDLIADSFSIFGDETLDLPVALNVIKCEVFQWDNPKIKDLHNLIIVTQKFSDKSLEKLFGDSIVLVPKLETWQIKDYVYSIAQGVDQKDLDWLINLCGSNIQRLQQELDKITLFREDERKYLFSDLIRDGAVSDLSSFNVFNFSNAITSKDMNSLLSVYKELDRVDVSEFGLLTILLNNFKNILMVQLNSNPTPENTGLDSKRLWAIKKIPRVYSPNQLVSVFQFLSDIDRQVKQGELPADILIDYMVIKILSM